MGLTNYMEKIVYERLQEYIAKHPKEFCTCERCQKDIMALALNRLPPGYIATHKGEVLTDFQFSDSLDRTRVLTEVIKAVQIVQKNPSHGSTE